MAENYTRDLRERGWTHVDFEINERDRASYAQLANRVISLASSDEMVADALRFDLFAPGESGAARNGSLGIGRSRNSADEKLYLHTGFQSRWHADIMISERNQPEELREFWPANDEMLAVVKKSMRSVLYNLGNRALERLVFPMVTTDRNISIRTVRYQNALEAEMGKEVVSGHADVGILTEHLYETHGGWVKGAPYPPSLISDGDTREHRADIRRMRRQLQPIDSRADKAVVFLGANWHSLAFDFVPEQNRDLPACYHAGFRPDPGEEAVSPYADAVTDGASDRVSVVVFAHPNIEAQKSGAYAPASVARCRPVYAA